MTGTRRELFAKRTVAGCQERLMMVEKKDIIMKYAVADYLAQQKFREFRNFRNRSLQRQTLTSNIQ